MMYSALRPIQSQSLSSSTVSDDVEQHVEPAGVLVGPTSQTTRSTRALSLSGNESVHSCGRLFCLALAAIAGLMFAFFTAATVASFTYAGHKSGEEPSKFEAMLLGPLGLNTSSWAREEAALPSPRLAAGPTTTTRTATTTLTRTGGASAAAAAASGHSKSTSVTTGTSSTRTETGTSLTTTAPPTTTAATTVTRTTTTTFDSSSLFCFSVMMPTSSEHDLLTMQFKLNVSIAACDGSAVYSNISTAIGWIATTVVDINMTCGFGGEFYTVLNTPVFAAVWEKVIEDGVFRSFGWTVKADPDAAFLPHRLRRTVSTADVQVSQAGTGIFYNNCKFGMHGPLEIVSRAALETYGRGHTKCVDPPPQEDVYLQACLLLLNVVQVDDFNLLAEDHCESENWEACENDQIAYHPFKKTKDYYNCLKTAKKHDGLWSTTTTRITTSTTTSSSSSSSMMPVAVG